MGLWLGSFFLSSLSWAGPDDCFKDVNGPRTEELTLQVALPAPQPQWQKLDVKFGCNEDGSEKATLLNENEIALVAGPLAELAEVNYGSNYRDYESTASRYRRATATSLNPVLVVQIESPLPRRKFKMIFRWKESRRAPDKSGSLTSDYIPFFQYAYLSFEATYQIYRWSEQKEEFELETKEKLPLLVDRPNSFGTVAGKKVKISGRLLRSADVDRLLCAAAHDLDQDARQQFSPRDSRRITPPYAPCPKEALVCQKKAQFANHSYLDCEAKFTEVGTFRMDLVQVTEPQHSELYLIRSHFNGDDVWKMPN